MKRSLFFFKIRNCPRTTYALSNPFPESLLPRTSPIPAKSVTGFSFIGSATKLRCFCDVVLILTNLQWLLSWCGILLTFDVLCDRPLLPFLGFQKNQSTCKKKSLPPC